jgi:hypothetical protein
LDDALALPEAYMAARNWNHNAMSARQHTLSVELIKSGRPNTMKEQNRIAVEALIAGGASRDEARSLVAASLAHIRSRGVKGPVHYSWKKGRKK